MSDDSLLQASATAATTKKVAVSIIALIALLAGATMLLNEQEKNPATAFSHAVNMVLHLGIPEGAEENGFLVLFSIAGAVVTVYLILIFISALYTNAIKKGLKEAKLVKKIQELSNHYIICGGGSLGFSVGTALVKRGLPAIVIDTDNERVAELNAADVSAIEGDCFDKECLRKAGVMKAKTVIACLNDDGDNVLVTMLVKEMNPNVKVIAEATYEKYVNQLKRAGADEVVLPREIGGMYIAKLAAGGSSSGVAAP